MSSKKEQLKEAQLENKNQAQKLPTSGDHLILANCPTSTTELQPSLLIKVSNMPSGYQEKVMFMLCDFVFKKAGDASNTVYYESKYSDNSWVL